MAQPVKIIDTDTHVTEPTDLWTSRLPQKWRDKAPQVAPDPATNELRWHVGDTWLTPVGLYSHAGWHEFVPGAPPSLDDADPACWEPTARLRRMDEYGIWAQVLYPNLMGFESLTFMAQDDTDFALACVYAYNDFTTEFASTSPERFIPITVVPFWDVDASLAEIERCAAMGHKGLLWANKFEQAELPSFVDRHWDPVYRMCEEMGLAVNFHVGFSSKSRKDTPEAREANSAFNRILSGAHGTRENPPPGEAALNIVRDGIPMLLGNAYTIIHLLTSDTCERFPTLKFVSVESGFGYVPYLLEACDWMWQNSGAGDAYKDRMLPSEYFVRQCYGSFWFEQKTLPLLSEYPDNFMFETDFPHPISMSPGPGSYADHPGDRAQRAVIDRLPEELARKVLHDNAASVYNLAPAPSLTG
jgi:predicted TIM-barrel fold metal-dependent hydrolase